MGLTQYRFGVENVKMVVNLALARGMIGRRKTGVMPIRGHSGVQGTAECGVDADKLPGGIDITDESVRALRGAWGHPIPAREGLRAAHLLDRAGETGLDLLYLRRRQPPRDDARPDSTRGARSASVKLRVHQDIVLNTSTLLERARRPWCCSCPRRPATSSARGGTSTSTERRIRFTPEIPRAAHRRGQARVGDPGAHRPALCARRSPTLSPTATPRESAREMARVMPLYAGIERLEKEGDCGAVGRRAARRRRLSQHAGRARALLARARSRASTCPRASSS